MVFISWNEILEFSVRIAELPQETRLVLSLHHLLAPAVRIAAGGTSLDLFRKSGRFRQATPNHHSHNWE